MKAVSIILKVLAVLAAVAGVVYVVATYGDKIVAWAKKLLRLGSECDCETCDCCCEDDCEDCKCQFDCDTQCPCECAAEEVAEEEAPAAEEPAVVAEENDFEGE